MADDVAAGAPDLMTYDEAVNRLRSLPVEQRMTALGMVKIDNGPVPHQFPTDAPDEVLAWKCQNCGEWQDEGKSGTDCSAPEWRDIPVRWVEAK